jgi:hypothetical protein
MAGVDLLTRGALLGHTKIHMTMRYLHPADEHKKEGARKIENFKAMGAIRLAEVCRRATRRRTCNFEEGAWAAWLYDLLKPHVTSLVVCDPRRNALLQEGKLVQKGLGKFPLQCKENGEQGEPQDVENIGRGARI